MIKFYHASAGSPVTSTWCKAIDNGHYTTWPSLTSARVRRHLEKSIPTIKGHLDQRRQGILSTDLDKSPPFLDPIAFDDELETDEDIIIPKSIDVCNAVYASIFTYTGKTFSDQTGALPVPSTKGNKYLLVVYAYDANAIIAEPIPSRTAKAILTAYRTYGTVRVDLATPATFSPRNRKVRRNTYKISFLRMFSIIFVLERQFCATQKTKK